VTIEHYRSMLAQSPRIEAFQRLVFETVRAGDLVAEIGAGLGTYSFFAARAGASRVFAIEGGPIAAITKAIARHNDLDDIVRVQRGWFPDARPPVRVDVVIFEDYPPRLLDEHAYHLLQEIPKLLTPNGRVIPARARICVAPVCARDAWRMAGPLGGDIDVSYGIDWLPSREYAANRPLNNVLGTEDIRGEARVIADIALDAAPGASALCGEAAWTFDRDTRINGLAQWFDLEVGPNKWLSNAPGEMPGSWGNLYLPITTPMTVPAGGRLDARVAPESRQDGAPGWLTWTLQSGSGTVRLQEQGHEFRSVPMARADLVRGTTDWSPILSDEGQVAKTILEMADGGHTVEQIAAALRGMRPAYSHAGAVERIGRTLDGLTVETSTAQIS
jgi:SAM-dependent methyltransferase